MDKDLNDLDRKRAYDREWYAKHKVRIRTKKIETGKRSRRNRLQWLHAIKSALGCAVCDEQDPVCLDFHHRDPSSKVDDVASMLHRCCKEVILAEIAKCDLLCCNCHRKEERRLRQCN
jgi:hypothetical protein